MYSFDDLRIRREKKDTKQKTPGGRKQSKLVATTNERNDKIACLRFTAVLEQPGGGHITVTTKSRSIILGKVNESCSDGKLNYQHCHYL